MLSPCAHACGYLQAVPVEGFPRDDKNPDKVLRMDDSGQERREMLGMDSTVSLQARLLLLLHRHCLQVLKCLSASGVPAL